MNRARRVVQWTTGKTGRAAVRAMVDHPAIEIVGCYAWSADKVGRDVGELCRIDPIGITATDDIDALLALRPDCVVYTPYRPDIDHVVRILEAGTNIVTSMYQLVGDGYGDDGGLRIIDAARSGNATLYARGTYPGHVPMVALGATAVCSRIERITLLESVDLRAYANEPMYRAMGIDRDPTDPEAAVLIEAACGSFRDQVAVMAHALAVDLDDITFHADFAVAEEDLDVGFMTIGKARVAAIRGTISGWAGGRSRIECRSVWKMGERTNPDWPVEHGYIIDVEGTPSFRVRIEPGSGWTGSISTALRSSTRSLPCARRRRASSTSENCRLCEARTGSAEVRLRRYMTGRMTVVAVLVHGAGHTAAVWRDTQSALAHRSLAGPRSMVERCPRRNARRGLSTSHAPPLTRHFATALRAVVSLRLATFLR